MSFGHGREALSVSDDNEAAGVYPAASPLQNLELLIDSAREPKVKATNSVASALDSPEQWVDDHGDALYAYAMTRVHQPAAAEDLVQETLLAGVEGMDHFKGNASTRTWLISIMKNKIVDQIRKLHREEPLDMDLFDDQAWQAKFNDRGHWLVAPTSWGDPSAIVENNAMGEAMMACIGELPEQLRSLIVMRDIDGYDTNELLDILNITSANNLWVMLSRGREKIRTCLDKNWFGRARS